MRLMWAALLLSAPLRAVELEKPVAVPELQAALKPLAAPMVPATLTPTAAVPTLEIPKLPAAQAQFQTVSPPGAEALQAPQARETQAVELSARFDGVVGRDGRSYELIPAGSWRVPGGRVGLTHLQSEDGGSLWISRRLQAGRIEVAEHHEGAPALGDYPSDRGRFMAAFTLDKGVLKARLKTKDERGASVALNAKTEFSRALSTFGRGVTAIEGNWSYGDNLAEFNRLTKSGLTAEEAAAKTWTGRQAAAAGFTQVVLTPQAREALKTKPRGQYSDMRVYFVRPEAVRVDKAGRLWRRTRQKAEKNDLWQRYESDGEAVWLLRRQTENEVLAYEFRGDERPEAGTPPAAMAVFSLYDGILGSHVSEAGATLLSSKEEFRRAVSLWSSRVKAVRARGGAETRAWTAKRAAEAGFTFASPAGDGTLYSKP